MKLVDPALLNTIVLKSTDGKAPFVPKLVPRRWANPLNRNTVVDTGWNDILTWSPVALSGIVSDSRYSSQASICIVSMLAPFYW